MANAPAGLQTLILAIVDRQIDDSAWGSFADDGRRYLAAHLGSLSYPGTIAPGGVTSESVGPFSRSNAMSPAAKSNLGTTSYGVMYLHLLGVAVGPGVLVS